MFSFFKKKNIISHIKLNVVIGNEGKFKKGIDFSGQEEIIKKAFSLKKAICVAISINSPGGSPVQSHMIHDFIRNQAKKHKKKSIIFSGELCATGGKNKSTLDPFLDEKSEDIERLKKIQLDLHQDFINVVESSRGSKLLKKDIELFSGEFWSGKKAKELGLIDGIGDADQILKQKYGDDIIIKKFEKPKSWLSNKLSSSNDKLDQLANIFDERSIWQKYGL